MSALKPRLKRGLAFNVAAAATASATSVIALQVTALRIVIAVTAVGLFVLLTATSPLSALYALLVWLALLGLIRRTTSFVSVEAPVPDPLLLVGPLALVLLAWTVTRGRPSAPGQANDTLSQIVIALTALFAVAAFNPLQGSLAVGLTGALLVVPSMLAFWVGRDLVDQQVSRRVVALLVPLALLVAGYGLVQATVAFPAWDAAWIRGSGYAALSVGGETRSFSTFASAAEYATFVGIGIVACVAFALCRLRPLLACMALVPLAIGMWFAAVRGAIVFTVVALVLIACARRGIPGKAALAIAAAFVLATPMTLTAAGLVTGQSGVAAHQLGGLSNPLGNESSVRTHIDLISEGVREGFANPIGRGSGAVTSAARELSGEYKNSESDLGNAGIALGIAGLALYMALVSVAFTSAYAYARRSRSPESLALLGILVVTTMQWLNGGHYLVTPVVWLAMGCLSRASGLPARLRVPASTASTT